MNLRSIRRVIALAGFIIAGPSAECGWSQVPETPLTKRLAAVGGTIRDSSGRPIAGATLRVDSTDRLSVSDDSGRFHLSGISAGRHDFTVRKIGYAAVAFTTSLAVDSTLVLDIRMNSLQTLDPVNVTTTRSKRLEQTGFFQRQSQGIGRFVSPERVDSLSHLPSPGYLLRGLPGLDVRCGGLGCSVLPRMEPRCLALFIDGREVNAQLDGMVSMLELYAIEVYDRPVKVPAEFQPRLRQKTNMLTVKAGCGVIAVWTRGRAAP